jgi:twitching motility protein PilT
MSNVSILELLREMSTHEASDLHIKEEARPAYRIHGNLTPIKRDPVAREEIQDVLDRYLSPRLQPEWERNGSVDFGFSLDRANRFRTNVYKQRGMISIAFRRLENQHLSFEELGLPHVMYDLAEQRRGMILITGPTGTGKSTTMAAMIDRINETRREHILTIEDPIEFVFQDKKSIIDQREIGEDATSFDMALRHALRQDPDVILVGEMRDMETISIAMRAAMTGHLLISTLHTTNATMTMNRILRYFPADEQESIRMDLAMCLKGVLSQRLVITSDKNDRVPIIEVMICNSIVAKLIREDRIDDVRQAIQNRIDGMQTFDQSLVDLVRTGRISIEDGENYCEDLQAFRRNIKGEFAGGDKSRILGAS